MKSKKCLMILFVVALLVSVFSVQTFAATQYTVTIKSNDGTETLWTQTVDSGSEFEILTYGARIVDSAESDYYNYSGSRQFLGFATSANSATVSSFYAVGYTGSVTSNLTLYVVDGDRMGAHTIVGDPITGADTYELWENVNRSLVKPNETCSNYLVVKYRTNENAEKYYYAAFVFSGSSVSCTKPYSSGEIFRYKFSTGNKGYYKIGIETLEEVDVYLLSEQTVQSFESVDITISDGKDLLEDYVYCSMTELEWAPARSSGGMLSSTKTKEVRYLIIPWEKIAESSELSFDLEALSLANGSHTFKVKAKGSGYYDSDFSNELTYAQEQKYSVTTTFTNLTAYNNYDMGGGFSYVYLNKPLSLVLSPTYGYLQPDEIVVTMGGTTLTAGTGYYYNAKDGSLVIPKVTGDITITAQGLLKVAAPVIEKEATGAFDFLYPLCLKFNEVNNASGYAAYVDGVEVTAADLKITVNDGVVLMYIPKTAFPASGTYSVYVKAIPVEGYMASNPSNTVTVDVTVSIIASEIVEASDLVTEEYLYAFRVKTMDPQATGLEVYLDGVKYENFVFNTLENDENYSGYVLIPAAAFVDGDGSFEIHVIFTGPSGTVASGPSNTLTFEVAKLATPEIRLE